ncbi:MAG: hypothetical protein HYV07_07795 [Deltaproteobacteria bacterium]|nr:hypothetical protein [Deltaproteobacteria bacterium]
MHSHEKADTEALEATLDLADVSEVKVKPSEILAASPAQKQENHKVHLHTNQLLLRVMGLEPNAECIHITGEMRALSDPFHRQVCRQFFAKHNRPISVVYNLPDDDRTSSSRIANWNRKRWSKIDWHHHLAAFDLIAGGVATAFAFNTLEHIQYTVFGHRYVLLQEKHVDRASAKRVWLLSSAKLNEALTNQAQSIIRGSQRVPSSLFRNFTRSLSSLSSLQILSILAREGEKRREYFDTHRAFHQAEIASSVDDLSTMGFISLESAGVIKITGEGESFLRQSA